MCTVMSTGPCNCHTSSGVSADDILAVAGGLAVITIGSAIVSTAPGFFGLVGVVMLVLAPNWSRRHAGRFLRWAVRALWAWLRRRHAQPAPGQSLAVAQRWHAVLTATTPTGTQALTAGTVYGTWTNAGHCEAEVVARAVRAYAERGEPPPGELRCKAEPLPGGGR